MGFVVPVQAVRFICYLSDPQRMRTMQKYLRTGYLIVSSSTILVITVTNELRVSYYSSPYNRHEKRKSYYLYINIIRVVKVCHVSIRVKALNRVHYC